LSKRKILGVPFPILIVLFVVLLALIIVGLLAGPIGQNVFHTHFPSWLVVSQPSPKLPAEAVFHVFGLPVTSTILAGWLTVVFLVVVSWLITRRMKLVPGRLQAVFEFILGWIYDLCKSVAGEENGRKFFPVVCTIFLFVAFNAWLSLIPGFGPAWYEYQPIPENAQIVLEEGGKVAIVNGEQYEIVTKNGEDKVEIEKDFLRGANTDINTPLAIALISFVFVEYYGLKTLSFSYLKKFLNFGQLFRSIGQLFKGKFNFLGLLSGLIDIAIGALEALSELIRNISFTFRLFGNMTAGEILILIAAFLIPLGVDWVVYGLELLIGFIQALVFSGLTLAFVTMAVASHNEEAH
jgi:F-type H+-transporting ATPase subunit a